MTAQAPVTTLDAERLRALVRAIEEQEDSARLAARRRKLKMAHAGLFKAETIVQARRDVALLRWAAAQIQSAEPEGPLRDGALRRAVEQIVVRHGLGIEHESANTKGAGR